MQSIRIRIFLFLSYSFGTETNTFVHSRSALVNHTRFQSKVYTLFQTKTKQNPLGGHIDS